jgi:hypothetical protein
VEIVPLFIPLHWNSSPASSYTMVVTINSIEVQLGGNR